MSNDIEFTPLATSEPLDDEQPITTNTKPTIPRLRRRPTLSARIEQLTDVAISGLGPVLLVVAFLLLSIVIFCFFTVVLPFHYTWKKNEDEEGSIGILDNLAYILHFVWSCYLVWGIAANYYYAVRTPPGSVLDGISSTGDVMFQDVLQQMETYTEAPPTCKRCLLPKPERTHHCSVCKRCVLKYDHHCPWIHNCVGHFNHRFFLMFLTYLSIACIYYVIMGAGPFMLAADMDSNNTWPYWLDRSIVAFGEVLAVAIGFAVGGMACWHWYLALTAQTTLEQYNNSYMKKICKKRGESFSNMYDFGIVGNFQDLFNIGPRGHYPWYTALLPLPIPPIGNGKRFERSGRGYILDFGEDDEDMV
ncbi:DHHC palmitoyltransferase-domain-containing protein [Lobosporangium transversale]|uniref:Palmitoyltransferase n=1 Tax=Lobosporangium transversale TaxID=64571 RepID=A0A1Y2GS64_9FUNG|nr:DHHC palmitoyltransferase-domain-containing protein [Lobosporangium transversale]ORZ16093.1 DHHC palmitoyltransferase-domain-containing protein [Lobosporangium transversale]|eukprot:XP_021881440.1 DHHC palmitoyltransferase-domain-containing protein [Lobosporangium transversale]